MFEVIGVPHVLLFPCSLTQGDFSLHVLSLKANTYMDTRKQWKGIFKVLKREGKKQSAHNSNLTADIIVYINNLK